MKKILFSGLLLAGVFAFFSFKAPESPKVEEAIQWMSWEEAIEASNQNPKKIFIDMYTDWCGWCKRMDATTFKDPEIVKYMNEHFYAVKFDAEQKEEVIYDGHTFKFVDSGRRGYHQLAASLLDGRLGYPSFVYMDEEQRRITISPGFKDADRMLTELKFIGGDHYKSTDFQSYVKNSK
jgi:thioredoxin-related protein